MYGAFNAILLKALVYKSVKPLRISVIPYEITAHRENIYKPTAFRVNHLNPKSSPLKKKQGTSIVVHNII